MELLVFTFITVFVLLSCGSILLFYREVIFQRVSTLILPEQKHIGLFKSIKKTGFSLTGIVGRLERVIPRSQAELSVIQRRLIRAGYRKESAVKIFYGAKALVPCSLALLVMLTGVSSYSPFFIYILALGLGFLLPDFWLGRRISNRQANLRRALPDVLDLMVVCIEAGQSLDQTTARTAEELKAAHPDMCDELGVVVLEQRAGRPRGDAWQHCADRTGEDSLRHLVAVVLQAEKFGTSIAKTLRIHADTLRTQRRQKLEEQAAKTTVKLVFPLVFFIFPSLFLVTLGPATIIMADSFQKYFNN